MKISIVIPTRNRCEFLKYCIQTCLISKDPDIEVVVSDNNSVDQTREIVSEIEDSRLRYVNPGRDLSMRQNFEFALGNATGDYVIFIGDDDGVIPNGIVTLRYLIEKYNPDIVIWRHLTYLWPHTEPVPTEGLLKFRYRDFCGPLYELNPLQIFSDFCNAKLVNYRDGANIYHGCVSRRVIEKVKINEGEYFQGQIPDVNTALSNLIAADTLLWLRNPITIAGAGEKSNGTAMNSHQKASKGLTKIAESFTTLASEDVIESEIDLRIRSITAYAYANLLRVNKDHLNGKYSIDHAAWRSKIEEDMRKFPPHHRCWHVLESFFAKADPNYVVRDCEDEAAPSEISEKAPHRLPGKRKKNSLVPTEYTENVAKVVEWLQTVTGNPYFPNANPIIARIQQVGKSLEMRRNTKKFK